MRLIEALANYPSRETIIKCENGKHYRRLSAEKGCIEVLKTYNAFPKFSKITLITFEDLLTKVVNEEDVLGDTK